MIRSALSRSILLAIGILALVAPGASAFGQLGGVNMVGGGPDAANFQLDSPSKIARVADGTFFVLDSGNSRMLRIDANGNLLYAFGGTSGNESLQGAYAFALASGGAEPDILISTFGTIKRFSSHGAFISSFGGYGTAPGQFASVGGMVVDPSCGELFVSDSAQGQYRVQRIALEDNPMSPAQEFGGQHLETIGQGAGYPTDWPAVDGKVNYPRELAFGDGSRLFVVDSGYSRVQVFSWTGNCGSRSFAYDSKFGSIGMSLPEYTPTPGGIAIDRSVNPTRIYVTNYYIDHFVKMFSATSATPGAANPPYTIPASGRSWGSHFDYPLPPTDGPDDLGGPISLAAEGPNAWVLEAENNRIHRYSGISSEVPFVSPTTSALWGRDGRDDGFFQQPGPAAATADGGAVVVDVRKCKIQRYAANGAFLGGFGACDYGAGGPTAGVFQNSPSGIAVAPNGDILASDPSYSRIQRFSSSGAYLSDLTWTPTGGSPIYPGAIDVDPQGNVWAWDGGNNKVVKVSSAGTVLASMGSNGNGASDDSLALPLDMVASDDGRDVYVLDYGANRIKKFTSPDGLTFTPTPASSADTAGGSGDGQLKGPGAIDLDPRTGELVVADSGNERVQYLSGSNYAFVSKFGAFGFEANKLNAPRGVAADQWGNLWVADSGNDSIKRFGDAPVVTLGALASTTTASSVAVTFTTTDPAATCDFESGNTMNLHLGANMVKVSCTNDQGTGTGSFLVTRTHVPPVVAITAPTEAQTSSESVNVAYTVNGGTSFPPGTTCTVGGAASSDTQTNSVALSLGANSISVSCSNTGGTDAAMVSVTRTAPPAGPAPGVGDAFAIKFPKKLKLSKGGKLALDVICPTACDVKASLGGGRIKLAFKSKALVGQQAAQRVSLKLTKKQAKKVRATLKAKKRVKLTVTVAAKGAKQGKSGSAILKR